MTDDMIRFWTSVVPPTTKRMEFMTHIEIKSTLVQTFEEVGLTEKTTNTYFENVSFESITTEIYSFLNLGKKPLHNSPELVEKHDIKAIDGEEERQRFIWIGLVIHNLVEARKFQLIWFHKVETEVARNSL